MKIVGIIPARYQSTRFPGKALADLDGRPLICHVCEAAANSGVLGEVYVATDSEAIAEACRLHGYPAILTSPSHQTPTERVREVSERLAADLYVMIGGDEPLILPSDILQVVQYAETVFRRSAEPVQTGYPPFPFVVNALGAIREISEAIDPANIKVVTSSLGEGLYASRSPIPYPKGTLDLTYRKFVSIGAYSKEALDFYISTPPSPLELAEEFDLLRFIEHHKPVLFTEIPTRTLSVDTPKDLERVRAVIRERRSAPEFQ